MQQRQLSELRKIQRIIANLSKFFVCKQTKVAEINCEALSPLDVLLVLSIAQGIFSLNKVEEVRLIGYCGENIRLGPGEINHLLGASLGFLGFKLKKEPKGQQETQRSTQRTDAFQQAGEKSIEHLY